MSRFFVTLSLGLDLEKDPDWSNPTVQEAMRQLWLGKMVTYPELTVMRVYNAKPAAQTETPDAPVRTALEDEVAGILDTLEEE